MTVIDLEGSRYDRQERIWWWDQSKLTNSRVLVVGAGALGNEIVKNLALVGVGQIDIVDMDTIENSNLARCALFRDSDRGKPKAEVLAAAASEINPEVQIRSFVYTVQQLGTGWLKKYDLVIAGLDNREARLWVNASTRRLGMFWVDGAIEGLQGVARVFGPSGPCFECTLGAIDRELLAHRRSCALLSPEEIASGRTPTNATTASIVGGLEVQEAIKYLVGRQDLLALTGAAWRMEGETMLTSVMQYTEDPDCLAHDAVENWVEVGSNNSTLREVLDSVNTKSDPVTGFYFSDDVIQVGSCNSCGTGRQITGLRPVLPGGVGRCDSCGEDLPMSSQSAIGPNEELMDIPLDTWLLPFAEVVGVASENDFRHFVLTSKEVSGERHIGN
jgi:molybdopterin/thiamine biosynthesis adenylyltransferase